jgi:hypothetical protein
MNHNLLAAHFECLDRARSRRRAVVVPPGGWTGGRLVLMPPTPTRRCELPCPTKAEGNLVGS